MLGNDIFLYFGGAAIDGRGTTLEIRRRESGGFVLARKAM